jgi:hypothetical protein
MRRKGRKQRVLELNNAVFEKNNRHFFVYVGFEVPVVIWVDV